MENQDVSIETIYEKAMQARFNVFHAKEFLDNTLKSADSQIDILFNLVHVMKKRMLEMEDEIKALKSILDVEKAYVEQFAHSGTYAI